MSLLTLINRGRDIAETNYWETEYEANGFFVLSCNAGSMRLLVPRSRQGAVVEMRTAKEVLVSRAQDGDELEILFEDGSSTPFALRISLQQVASLLPLPGEEGTFDVWELRDGEPVRTFICPALYRRVPRLPWLKPRGE